MDSYQDSPQLAADNLATSMIDGELEMADSASIGNALITHAKLSQKDVDRVLALQIEKNLLFGEAAKQLGLITEDDLQKVLSQQFNYAYLQEGSNKLSQLLTAAHKPFSAEVESLRSLRSQLLMRWFDHGSKTLAITSASNQDSASLLAGNLAIVFSQLNKKTLLIDANLRQPSQHKLFNIDIKVGLSNILANIQGSYTLVRQPSLPNLAILTAGTAAPNPQELLSQSGFAELILDLEKVYDIIIVDTSPLAFGSDVLTVVSKVKAAIIVAKKDTTVAADVQYLSQQIAITGAKVIGSVFLDTHSK
jgi:protein-tyrosine kinase